jgi:hypothetical protein
MWPGADVFALNPDTSYTPYLAASQAREYMIELVQYKAGGGGPEYERLWVQLFSEVHSHIDWEDGVDGASVAWELLNGFFPQRNLAQQNLYQQNTYQGSPHQHYPPQDSDPQETPFARSPFGYTGTESQTKTAKGTRNSRDNWVVMIEVA